VRQAKKFQLFYFSTCNHISYVHRVWGESKSTATAEHMGKTDRWQVQCKFCCVPMEPSSPPRVVPPGYPNGQLRGSGVPRGGSVLRPPLPCQPHDTPPSHRLTTRSLCLEPPPSGRAPFLRIDRTIQEHYCGCQVGQIQHIVRTTRGRGMGLSEAIASLPHTYSCELVPA
jgi:hypothetical protein